MHFLVKEVPSCWYTVPASPLPMLILTIKGAVEMEGGRALPAMSILGASRCHYRGRAEPGSRFMSTAFRPGKLSAILGCPVDEFSDQVVDLHDILPSSTCHELSERLASARDTATKVRVVQDMLIRLRLLEKPHAPPLILPHLWLNKPADELATCLGLGTRQFERRFLATFGQSLRSFKQQSRFGVSLLQILLGQLPAKTWAECALSFGYADQAHMNRDFTRFADRTPAQLMRGIAGQDPALWAFSFNVADLGKFFVPSDDLHVVSVQDQTAA
ncbi:helix-turn-helix domain-containing protein [Undibacterium sp. Di27W]|uniref:AraC family transcriptional regulator n=1 Tax=Undibacterium sp. Di27W TaxID=3413036 RepID=UPI003BF0BD93